MHIGFIMDGNRRYAKKNGLSNTEGYRKGLETFLTIVSAQIKFSIQETTFFALSKDNYKKRPTEELDQLFQLFQSVTEKEEIRKFFTGNRIKITLKGNIEELERKEKRRNPERKTDINRLKQELDSWNESVGEPKFWVNLAINYDGQGEIVKATREIAEKVANGSLQAKNITEKTIKQHLWFTGNMPEIIVRTGNASRISGFLLWDSQYSELYMAKKLWPEFDETDIYNILQWYKTQQRNFGQ